ncbi:MAG: hypothetical protein M3071_24585 [Actinomycetota bacterium]|nr:hypothetical protein [Actinomycetota bacterium]
MAPDNRDLNDTRIVSHPADGPTPDRSYMTSRDAHCGLPRRSPEHEAVPMATRRRRAGRPRP